MVAASDNPTRPRPDIVGGRMVGYHYAPVPTHPVWTSGEEVNQVTGDP